MTKNMINITIYVCKKKQNKKKLKKKHKLPYDMKTPFPTQFNLSISVKSRRALLPAANESDVGENGRRRPFPVAEVDGASVGPLSGLVEGYQ